MRRYTRAVKLLLWVGALGLTGCEEGGAIEDLPGLAAMCGNGEGTGCTCSGVLITSDVVLSARHCDNIPWVVVGREDPADADAEPPGSALRTSGRCIPGSMSDADCYALTQADLNIYPLSEPVGADVETPARLATLADRLDARWIAAGRGGGTFRSVELDPPEMECPALINTEYDGDLLCFAAGGTGALTDGDSGGPLFVLGTDGEYAVAAVYAGFLAGFDIFTTIEEYKQYLPGVSRPPFFIDPEFLFPWRRQCVWPLPGDLVIYTASTQSADFDGDGDDEGCFESDDGVPYLLLEPEEAMIETAPLIEEASYPFSNLAVDLVDSGGAEMATIDLQGNMHVVALSEFAWEPTSLPPVALAQFDPLWGGADLATIFEPERFTSDPLLRAGDFDGDGRADLLASLEDNLVVLHNGVQVWSPSATAFEALGIPNDASYRESLTVADVDPNHIGDELIVRRECGLAVFAWDPQLGFTELFDQGCDESPWVASDANGYGGDNRWRIAAGNLNGDSCADLVVRSASEVYQLFASCQDGAEFSLVSGPATGLFFRGPIATYPGWSEGLQGSLLLADLDGDGLDDLTANSPYGIQAHINQNDAQLPFASIGGLDPELAAAALPHLPIDSWASFMAGRFNGENREYISYSASLGCFEHFWFFD